MMRFSEEEESWHSNTNDECLKAAKNMVTLGLYFPDGLTAQHVWNGDQGVVVSTYSPAIGHPQYSFFLDWQ